MLMIKKIKNEIIHFFQSQGCVIVSTITKQGALHNSCKGIIEIKPDGRIYLLDLYRGSTYNNLISNPNISITAIDEHKFKGYCLVGKARILTVEEVNSEIIKAWEVRLTSRITQRVLKNIAGDKGHPHHPEALLPEPKYIIAMQTKEVVDLTPYHLKQGV